MSTPDDTSEKRGGFSEKHLTGITETNEALRRQLDILERAPILIRDLDDRITTWCQGVEKLYGWTAQEALGKKSHELFKTEFPEPLEEIRFKVMRDGAWSGELSHIARDGRKIYVSCQWILYKDDSGKPVAIIEINNDITEYKRAEKALQESEEKARQRTEELATLMDIAPAAIWVSNDLHCSTIIGNKVATRFYEAAEGDNLSAGAIGGEQDLTRRFFQNGCELKPEELPMQAAAANGIDIIDSEVEVLLPSGKLITILGNAKPLFDSNGKIRGSIATFIDITERKRSEKTLRGEKERLQLILQSSAVGTFEVDLTTGVGRWNDVEYELLGLRPGDAPGGPERFFSYVHPQDVAGLRARWEEATQTGKLDTEFRVIRADGQERWLVGKGRFMFTETVDVDSVGKKRSPLRFLGVNYDITERKRIEEALQRAKDELELRVQKRTVDLVKANEELMKARDIAEAAVEAKAAFLANMSHELRTPMNAVIGFSNLLMDDNLTPDQKDFIERIRVGGEALLSLINNILDFSKMEKNKVELEHYPLSLRSLAEESLGMVAIMAKDKGLDLGFTISYGMPDVIIGDQGRLRQILVNLLSNAVKFTDVGEVSLSISSKALEESRHRFDFAIKDTGIGIPEDFLAKLFQPFSQVEAAISSTRGGTGLGLAISKKLVDLMGGRIWADSSPGAGSIFHFTIDAEVVPGRLADSDRSAKSTFEKISEKYPMRILVAEDVPSNQRVLIEMLRRMGYRADMAADGFEVLEALERQPYDLILMDVKMPEMDGLEATRQIRKRWPIRPKIIAVTAYALEGDRKRCLDAGMDDYIAKPVEKGALAEMLKKCALKSQ